MCDPKWRGSAGGSIELSGQTGREPYRTTIAIAPPRPDDRHGALRHLWARTRIANLDDFGPRAADSDRVAEMTSLGLNYGLLTRYTSFVAVQEIVRRSSGDADDVDQPLPLPSGVSDLAVGVRSGAEPDLLWVSVLVLALISGARALLGRRQPPSRAAA